MIPVVEFAFGSSSWKLNMWTREVLQKVCNYSEKKTHQFKEIAETLEVAKSTIWHSLKKRNALASSATQKSLKDH